MGGDQLDWFGLKLGLNWFCVTGWAYMRWLKEAWQVSG